MKILINKIEYTINNDNTISHIFGRDENKNFQHIIIKDLNPFFYVNNDEEININNRIIRIEELNDWKTLDNKKIKKIICKTPADVGGNRKDNEGERILYKTTYEDDILFVNRIQIELEAKSGIEVDKNELSFYIDKIKPIDFNIDLKIFYIDIEVDSTSGFPNFNNAINKIYSISIFDVYTEKFYCFAYSNEYNEGIYNLKFNTPIIKKQIKTKLKPDYSLILNIYNNEIDMLNSFCKFIKNEQPDIISGWNIYHFDIPYLISRMHYLNVNYSILSPINEVYIFQGTPIIKGLNIFDVMKSFKRLQPNEIESLKLDDVSSYILGIGKVKHNGIDNLYNTNFYKFIKYNVNDVFLTYIIDKELNIFNFFNQIRYFVGCGLDDVLFNSRIIDLLILHKAHKEKIVLPSKRQINDEETYEGALTLQPKKKGIHNNIAVFDFTSLYPNIVRTWNIGIETLIKNTNNENLIRTVKSNIYFDKNKKSFLSDLIDEFIELRKYYKNKIKETNNEIEKEHLKLLETNIKFITNSIYGVLGYSKYRLYNKEIAEIITITGKYILNNVINFVNKSGYEVIYGDTDSIFVNLKSEQIDEQINEANILLKQINEHLKSLNNEFNLKNNYIEIKFEKIYKNFVVINKKETTDPAKKKYFGLVVYDGNEICHKFDIKGFIRTDTSKVGLKILKTIFKYICENKIDYIISYIQNEIKLIKNNNYELKYIAFSKGISKNISQYIKNNKIREDWILATEWTNQHSGLPEWNAQTRYNMGSKPKFIYVKKCLLPKRFERINNKHNYQMIALDENNSLPECLKLAIDYDTLIEKTIKNKIENLLNSINLSWKMIDNKLLINFM